MPLRFRKDPFRTHKSFAEGFASAALLACAALTVSNFKPIGASYTGSKPSNPSPAPSAPSSNALGLTQFPKPTSDQLRKQYREIQNVLRDNPPPP
jgi:hypothetical protein